MKNRKLNPCSNNKGQALTEYITLLILVALVAVGGAQRLGSTIKGKIARANKKISKGISFKDTQDIKGSNSNEDSDFGSDAD